MEKGWRTLRAPAALHDQLHRPPQPPVHPRRELQLRRLQDPRRRQLPPCSGPSSTTARPTPRSSRSSSPTPTPGPSRPGWRPPRPTPSASTSTSSRCPSKISVLGYEMEARPSPRRAARAPRPSPGCGRPTRKTYVMPYYADFVPKRSVRLPFAYLVPARRDRGPREAPPARPLRRAPDRGRDPRGRGLPAQGDQGGRAPLPGPPDQHGQGRVRRREAGVPGRDARRPARPSPWAALAAYLLEPESDDGLLVWNFFDRDIVSQWGRGAQTYPVYKLYDPREPGQAAGVGKAVRLYFFFFLAETRYLPQFSQT